MNDELENNDNTKINFGNIKKYADEINDISNSELIDLCSNRRLIDQ